MEIRKLKNSEIDEVVALWYETSVQAHDFISPSHWERNREAMATQYLPNSDTHVAIENNEIVGFVAMVESYLAAIFVSPSIQGKGVGHTLLDFVKESRETIELKVYKKNSKALAFYKGQSFLFVSEDIEKETGEVECLLEWGN